MNALTFPPPSVDWNMILPVVTVIATGVVVLIWQLFVPRRENTVVVLLSLAGLAAAGYFSLRLWDVEGATFAGALLSDRLAVVANLILIATTFLTLLFSEGYLRERRANFGEYYPMVLWATAGAMLMVATTDLIVLFLGLETLSISLYVLAGLTRADRRSEEAAIKYFLLGAFASAFLLYGIALIYGATGTSQIGDVPRAWGMGEDSIRALLVAGVSLLLVGLGFKAALVPFHMWTPDVYQGAPTSVTAYMAAVAKTAAFVTLIRVLWAAVPLAEVWVPVLTILAVLTMTVGNLLALAQTDVKRMLAYSSIAHAGYMVVGLLADDIPAVVYYLIAYSLMTIGSFAVVGLCAKSGQEGTSYSDMRGLWRRAPFPAAMMLIFLVSLAGIPPTAGFFGKLLLFRAALNANLVALAIVLAVNALVSVYYYLKLTIAMYVDDEREARERPTVTLGLVLATLACAVGILYVGVSTGHVQRLLTLHAIGG
jgi:NADH-quinone oxidoreductase subunit N